MAVVTDYTPQEGGFSFGRVEPKFLIYAACAVRRNAPRNARCRTGLLYPKGLCKASGRCFASSI
jgi:hypothetical protein